MTNPELPEPDGAAGNPQPQQVRQHHVSARVPESVSCGVFSNAVIVMTGASEFILDFVQNLGHPPQVSARIVLPHGTMPQFIDALRKNIDVYTQRFGAIPELPKSPQPARQQTPQEVYDDFSPNSFVNTAEIVCKHRGNPDNSGKRRCLQTISV